VFAQLPASADNVALPASSRRRPLRRPCSDRSVSPARRAHSSKPAAVSITVRHVRPVSTRNNGGRFAGSEHHAASTRSGCSTHRCTPSQTGPSRPVNSALHPSRGVAKSTTSLGWSKGGNVTSAGWQVTLCDPIQHVRSRSGEAGCKLQYCVPFTLPNRLWDIFLPKTKDTTPSTLGQNGPYRQSYVSAYRRYRRSRHRKSRVPLKLDVTCMQSAQYAEQGLCNAWVSVRLSRRSTATAACSWIAAERGSGRYRSIASGAQQQLRAASC